jgi:shikimate dehydrogenase
MIETTKIFAVTGKPVLHSKSPILFNPLFQKDKENAVYIRLSVEQASEAIAFFKEIGLSGMNVTSPFKQRIMPMLDTTDPTAEAIGAANTVVQDGEILKGSNTDHLGVISSFQQQALRLKGRQCLVLGAGGAGKAAVFGLVKEGADVTVVNRTYGKAVQTAKTMGCRAAPLDDLRSLLKTAGILVSALAPRVNPVRREWLQPSHIVFDANYPLSPLIEMALSQGCTVIRGEEWLLNQAVPVYKLFTGKVADRQLMKDTLSDDFKSERNYDNISLIGFMGCGKTTVGRILAKKLEYSFKDIDTLIEEREGQTITQIFRTQGEQYFRSKEKAVLSEIQTGKNAVYACGGGIAQDPANRKTLAQNSLVVWLHSPLEIIHQRIAPGSRPLLDGDGQGEKPGILFTQRIPYYAKTTDLAVFNNTPPEKTAERIHEEIHKSFAD